MRILIVSLIIKILISIPFVYADTNAVSDNTVEELSYKDCDGCHDGIYRERFDYNKNPECFECHIPLHSIPGVSKIDLTKSTSNDTNNIKISLPILSQESLNDSVEMIKIPAGVFIMGNDDRIEDEAPRHTVYVKEFMIDKYEVTNERYEKFVKATGYNKPRHWKNGVYPHKKRNHPVVYVNWYDAYNYCKWAGKRLPTEAEWEKAARGVDGRDFPWGNDLDPDKTNMPLSEIGDTTPVGKYENGKSPYGIYDMAGNVYEWVQEWYYLYHGSPADDFNKFSGRKNKILKGGSWYNCLTYACGISIYTYNRAFLAPEISNNSSGIRCASTQDPR